MKLRPSCRARQRRCEECKESSCSHAGVAARARCAARVGGTRPHSILLRQARSSMRARLATRCTTRRHGRNQSQRSCSTTCCRSWWRSSTASIACAAAAPRTAPVKPARAPPAHGPSGDATHRCLHEQLLAAEAARGTLVLDVQNVRDHVRSRAARPEPAHPHEREWYTLHTTLLMVHGRVCLSFCTRSIAGAASTSRSLYSFIERWLGHAHAHGGTWRGGTNHNAQTRQCAQWPDRRRSPNKAYDPLSP